MSDKIMKRIDIDKYIHLIPEYLRDNDSFLVFFQLLVNEFNITQYNIERFPDLVNPDKVPYKFIEYLGMYFNYHYQDRGTEEFNRDLLMSQKTIWEMRGTDHAIIMAATHGDNEGYVGGDIFIPGYPISTDLAEIIVARDKVFIHSKSSFSGSDVYSDSAIYRPGIIIISVPYINRDIRDRIDEVIPAGLKYVFRLISNFAPTEGADLGQYGELSWGKRIRVVPITPPDDPESINNAINLSYEINLKVNNYSGDTLIHSTRGRFHSGKQQVSLYEDRDFSIGVSCLPISVLRRKFPLSSFIVDIHGKPILPDNASSPVKPSVIEELISPDTPVEDLPIKDFRHSESKHSGEAKLGGKYINPFHTDLDQDFVEEDPEDKSDEEKEELQDDSKFYTISSTGEYLDRIDKLTTDSVIRKVDTTIDVSLKREVRMSFVRSDPVRGRHSYHGKRSGIFTGEFCEYVGIHDIQPFDVLYNACEVWDCKPEGFMSSFYQAPMESSSSRELSKIYAGMGIGKGLDISRESEEPILVQNSYIHSHSDSIPQNPLYRSGRFLLDIEREIIETEDTIEVEYDKLVFSKESSTYSGSNRFGGLKKKVANPESIVDCNTSVIGVGVDITNENDIKDKEASLVFSGDSNKKRSGNDILDIEREFIQ